MKKTILALAAAATIAAATLSAPTTADAQRRGLGLGLGVLGGVVLGTIIGTAIVNHDGYYRYDDYRDAPQGCYWARKAWRDEDGNVHYGRPRQFCD
jgi:MFS family permease